MQKFIVLFITFLLTSTNCYAKHLYKEREYQNYWCNEHGGISEYLLNDNTRVDCLTENYAIEFDFAPKWAEAIGQSLYYGIKTERKPAVVLIIESPADWKYYYRIEKVAQLLNITLWYMKSPMYDTYHTLQVNK